MLPHDPQVEPREAIEGERVVAVPGHQGLLDPPSELHVPVLSILVDVERDERMTF